MVKVGRRRRDIRLQFGLSYARIAANRTFGGRLMAGQGTLDPSIEVRILAPEPSWLRERWPGLVLAVQPRENEHGPGP